MGQPSTNQTTVRLLLILVAALALFGLITYYNSARQHPKDSRGGGSINRAAGSERFNVALQPAAVSDDMRGQPFNSAPLSAPAPRMISSSSSSAPVASNQGGPTSSSSVASLASAAFDVPRASEPMSNEQYRPVPGYGGAAHPADTFPQDQLRPEDLLPKDAANSKFAQVNPAGQGDVQDQNFLTAGFHMGTDTVGPSMRNASRDIRSTPPNPRVNVGIWNMSTITPDLSRRPLE